MPGKGTRSTGPVGCREGPSAQGSGQGGKVTRVFTIMHLFPRLWGLGGGGCPSRVDVAHHRVPGSVLGSCGQGALCLHFCVGSLGSEVSLV